MEFVMMMGLPGSGKTTYVRETYPSYVHLNADDIREELFGSAEEQKDTEKVFELMRKRTLDALAAGKDVVYDATNMSEKRRRRFLKQLPECRKTIVCMVVPVEVCKERQKQRDRVVPDYVIDRMVKSFWMPTKSEGWDEVKFVRKDTDGCSLEGFLNENYGVTHDNPHHARDVYEHMMAVEEAARNAGDERIVRLACRYHDIGKKFCKTFFDAKGNPSDVAHFYGHENVGAYFALCCKEACAEMAFLINQHMHSKWCSEEKLAQKYGALTAARLGRINLYDRMCN